MMRVVYDKDGSTHTLNPVDARERIAAGIAWAEPPVAPVEPVAPVASAADAMTIVQLREWLKVNGVTFASNAPKAELVALHDARVAQA